jgi:hypothetical protein
MYAIILTLVLSTNSSMSTTSFGNYNSNERCEEIKTQVLKSYVGTKFSSVTARCVPIE